MIRLAAIAIAAALAAGGCSSDKKDEAPVDDRRDPVTKQEGERGIQACEDYAKRLCACAETKPELADECELKRGKAKTLRMLLQVNRGDTSTDEERARTERAARRNIAACLEGHTALDEAGCPR